MPSGRPLNISGEQAWAIALISRMTHEQMVPRMRPQSYPGRDSCCRPDLRLRGRTLFPVPLWTIFPMMDLVLREPWARNSRFHIPPRFKHPGWRAQADYRQTYHRKHHHSRFDIPVDAEHKIRTRRATSERTGDAAHAGTASPNSSGEDSARG